MATSKKAKKPVEVSMTEETLAQPTAELSPAVAAPKKKAKKAKR